MGRARQSDDDRPLCVHADERDREQEVRRRLTRERCELVEAALEALGFARGTSYWSVALLVTRVSEGWRPLVRTLDDLAADGAIETTATDPSSRKRIVRRALDELARWGLLHYTTTTGETRRRTRPRSILTITLDRDEIARAADGEPPDRDRDNAADNGTDNAKDRPRTTERTTRRTAPGHFDGQTAAPSSSSPLLPKAPSPWDAAAAAMDGFVRLKERTITEASEAGMTPSDLVALVRQTRTARLEGGAVLEAIRSGDWRDLVASVAKPRPQPDGARKSAEQIRIRTLKEYQSRHGPAFMDDPPVVAEIALQLLAAGKKADMTPAEARAASSMNTYTGTVR